jgi:recombination protein RecT
MSENTPATQPVAKIDALKKMLNASSVQEQFTNTLKEGKGIFIASLIDLYNNDNNLQQCEPKAVVMEALKAAALKLPINKQLGFAYVLAFNNSKKVGNNWVKVMEPVFILGYKGYIQLAMRTGQYKTINADVVYEGEVQKSNKLAGELHFDGKQTSEKIIGYFAYFELLNGFTKTLYIEVLAMAKHAKRYSPSLKNNKDVTIDALVEMANSNKESSSVGWLGNFTDMAMKTCVRELLSKWGYMSVEMQEAYTTDKDEPENTNLPAISANKMIIDIDAEESKDPQTEDQSGTNKAGF